MLPANLDSTKLVLLAGPDSAKIYRTDIELRFRPNIPDSTKHAFFVREGLSVLGRHSVRGIFFVRMPDPGTSIEVFQAALDSLRAKPEVQSVMSILWSELRTVRDARYPDDGTGWHRQDWAQTGASTWAMRAIRAPLAWGCENGDHGGAIIPVGVLEYKHQPLHPEFLASTPLLWEPSNGLPRLYRAVPAVVADSERTHSTMVTGLITASGNDSGGVAGVMWRTRLDQFAVRTGNNSAVPLLSGFYIIAEAIVNRHPRVLNISVDQALPTGYSQNDQAARIEDLAGDWT